MAVITTQRKCGKQLMNLQTNSQKPLLYQNLTKKHEIADALNSHFNEVASRLVKNMPQSSRTPESYATRPDTQFTIQNVSLTKAGSKTNCDNHRPISVLSSVAKIYEKLVTEQLEIYLETNHILVEQQAGFRKNHSTQTSPLNITNQWLMNMDKSYLSSRIQICKVDQTMSKTRTVKCGIPQGSNLGPLLFLLYINDLPNCPTSSSASMFTDDTNISTNGKTNDELQERINVDLENVHQWLLANKLTLNKDKTEYMIIGSRLRISNLVTDPKIELGESVMKRVHK
ncbi:Hypothetical predicted protein [Paramuricea clavata]|uniref:Uncharacterized protein n=1 Tax=Paramuricea clavata TaxID=317549 RepID=A0A6S7H5F5_PARCT|nr:Hypothetical predicted protein [Paramuricea clavata]